MAVTCPSCKTSIDTSALEPGQRAACPNCGQTFFYQAKPSPPPVPGQPPNPGWVPWALPACPHCRHVLQAGGMAVVQSDGSTRCEQCGRPFQLPDLGPRRDVQTVELTAKRWKTLQAAGAVGLCLGLVIAGGGMAAESPAAFLLSLLVLLPAIGVYTWGRVGAWWHHG